jgi:cytochrome c biogenesis protein CcmG/thiol:disulfide interchange protein DsbE
MGAGMRKFWLWVPFALFVGLFGVFAGGLFNPVDRYVASGMVGRSMPHFSLVGVPDATDKIESGGFADGKPRLLNIFGSWCVPCVAEVPVLVQMRQQGVDIVGIAIHDKPEAIAKFLADNGDPYSRIALDNDGQTQIGFGSAGVPETFVVDGKGVIRHQHIGVITPNDVPIILAKLRSAQ